MTEEASLLAAIAAAPDDDAPRLVLADLLTSRGDPRGELIVLQCRLATLSEDDPAAAPVGERVRKMLEAGWKAYAGELAPYAAPDAFERGFVHRVRMTLAAFGKHGARVFGEYPTHTLVVTNDRWDAAALTKFASQPALANVRGLWLSQSVSAAARNPLAPLARSPHLQRLEVLGLGGCGHSAADWKQLFEKLDAPALAKLELSHCRTSASIQAAIARNPALSKLRTLDEYVYDTFDKKGAAKRTREAYATLAMHVALEHLNVEQHELVDDAALAPFFDPDSAAQLRSLTLSMTGATGALFRAIARSPKAATLETLEVHDANELPVDDLAVLLASPYATRLSRLAVTTYGASDDATARYEQLLLGLPTRHPLRSVGLPGRREGSPALRERFPTVS